MSPPTPNLGARSLAAVFWGGGGTILRLAMQIGTQIFLARLLGPEHYGVFAIGATVISLSGFFSDIGLAYSLIQRADVTERDIRFVFTWQVLLGLVVSLLVFGAADPAAAFFGEPRSGDVLRALSLLCLLNALAAPSLNLLKRSLDFKHIQLAQLGSYFIGYVLVGIPLALHGQGVVALVVAWLVQAVVNLGVLYLRVRHPLKPLLWYEHARSQGGYGLTVLATNLVNWAINNIDRVVVGRMFGSRDIGLYATSYNLLYTPSSSILGVVQPVFFSASSRVADDPERILRGYKALLCAVCLLVLPAFAVLAVLAHPFVAVLYGPGWADAAPLIQAIALAMPLFLLWGFTTPLLWTSGRAASEFKVQLPVALLWLGSCLLASTQGLKVLAWCVPALFALRFAAVARPAMQAMGLSASQLWACVRGGLAVTAAMAAGVALLCLALAGRPPMLQLLAGAVAAGLLWLLLLRWQPGWVVPELRIIFARVLGRLPAPLQRYLSFLAGPGGST